MTLFDSSWVDVTLSSIVSPYTSVSSSQALLLLDGARSDTLVGFYFPLSSRLIYGRIPSRKTAECLAVFVQNIAEKYAISMQELLGISCGIGPGSFTGLRITLSFAKALASTLNLSLYAPCSLRSLLLNEMHSIENTYAFLNAYAEQAYLLGKNLPLNAYTADEIQKHFHLSKIKEGTIITDGPLPDWAQKILPVHLQIRDTREITPVGWVKNSLIEWENKKSVQALEILPHYIKSASVDKT